MKEDRDWYLRCGRTGPSQSRFMNHRIIGTTLPVLEFQLQPGESVVAVSGELSWMSHSIQLKTGAQHGDGGSSGRSNVLLGAARFS